MENLTGLHIVSSSLQISEETISLDYESLNSHYSMTSLKQEVNYVGSGNTEQEGVSTSSDSFEEYVEAVGKQSVICDHEKVALRSSTRSMDHPYRHQEQQHQTRKKLKDMQHSASDSKLTSSSSLNTAKLGVYQRIDEDQEENSEIQSKSSDSPSIKRRLFRKSKDKGK